MPDRVKEAVFSILGSHFGCLGTLPSLLVADVFAGSGSIGLEALSRGAATCCFFERDRQALNALRRNIEALGAGEAATVVTRDAWRHAVSDPDEHPFDLVFLDPPYRDSQDTSENGAVRRYLARMGRPDDDKPLVVLHHSVTARYEAQATDLWRIVDQRTFGTNSITFFVR